VTPSVREYDVLYVVHEMLNGTVVHYYGVLGREIPIRAIEQCIKVFQEKFLARPWLFERGDLT
jgi:hypothetical protein